MSLKKSDEISAKKNFEKLSNFPTAGPRLANLGWSPRKRNIRCGQPQAVRKYRFLSGTTREMDSGNGNRRVSWAKLAGGTEAGYRAKTVRMDETLSLPRLALIGMSGAGKSFWSKRLAESGYPAFCCDDHIERRLQGKLRSGGHVGINGVASWMGWPDSATYAEREADYLAEEIATLGEVLTQLEQDAQRPLILDTTGSVIYAGNNLLLRLRRQMTVVYLEASAAEQQLLIERYLNEPKPVLWRGAFQPKKGETARETVARCYPTLINTRRLSYEALAHCRVPLAELREASLDAGGFLRKVASQLEKAK